MKTSIQTGYCSYRARKKQNPYFVTWIDKGKRYYAYFSSEFMAASYKKSICSKTFANTKY